MLSTIVCNEGRKHGGGLKKRSEGKGEANVFLLFSLLFALRSLSRLLKLLLYLFINIYRAFVVLVVVETRASGPFVYGGCSSSLLKV